MNKNYKLSDEHFYNEYEITLNEAWEYGNFITDGIRCYDKRVVLVKCNNIHKLSDFQKDPIINSTNDNILKKVLNTKNEIKILPVAYKNILLAKGNNIEQLVDIKYIDENGYCTFYYDNKIYFFELLEAVEEMGINEDAYMFVYFAMCKDKKYKPNKKNINILKKLNKLCEQIEKEDNN